MSKFADLRGLHHVDPALTALPSSPTAPLADGIPSDELVAVLDSALRGTMQARFAWSEHLGDLTQLTAVPPLPAEQWADKCAVERGVDLALRLRTCRRHVNGEAHLHAYFDHAPPRTIREVAEVLLGEIDDVVRERKQRTQPTKPRSARAARGIARRFARAIAHAIGDDAATVTI
jgi:hypothetical protein